jgi:hypothetical protein
MTAGEAQSSACRTKAPLTEGSGGEADPARFGGRASKAHSRVGRDGDLEKTRRETVFTPRTDRHLFRNGQPGPYVM